MFTRRAWGTVVSAGLIASSFLLVGTERAGATGTLGITTAPALYPAFSPSVSDYVIRCGVGPVSVSVTDPPNTEVIVDNQPGQTSSFTTSVSVTTGQSFAVTSIPLGGGSASTYFIRCLPTDYPNFTSEKTGSPQAQYYLVQPVSGALFSPSPPPVYLTLFDTDGVPVWWLKQPASFLGEILSNNAFGSIFQRASPVVQVHDLSGNLLAGFNPVGTLPTDSHDLQLLPDGNYLLGQNTTRTGNLTFMGGPASATILDQVIEEVTPAGTVVWSWDTFDHIDLTQVDPEWYSTILNPTGPSFGNGYDTFHWNSAEELGNVILLSFRHEDAVYEIDRATGNIIWKLGGSKIPQSLKINNDPLFQQPGNGFGGQHDARFYGSTNAVTLHDNGTGRNRAPRGVLYTIDMKHRTATLQESISDPLVPSSPATGSAVKIPGGDWVASWGFSPIVTELSPAGARAFLLEWTDPGVFSYRANPVMPGIFTITQLRSAMNTMYPRS